MANLLEKLIALVSNTSYESKAHHTTPVYTRDSSGLTGVEKYLEKQAMASREKALASATGVEKYLQKQAMAAKEKTVATAAGTGVEKYLEKQAKAAKEKPAVVAAPATGVEKYLGKKAEVAKVAPAKKEKPAPASTGVGKYLEKKVVTPEEITAPVTEETVSVAETTAPENDTAAPTEAAAPVETAPDDTAKSSSDAKQCQASTLKGTQCKNTTNLSQIQRTINKKKYMFTVCKQHSNDAFKPYSAFVESE